MKVSNDRNDQKNHWWIASFALGVAIWSALYIGAYYWFTA